MNFGSVCSGIEAASQAWGVLGWKAEFVSEIEPFPCAVLAHHHPDVPNHGDMTKFQEWPDHAIDLLVGGTPCQSFSVAGLRAGLADPRGNLMLTYLAIAARYRPRWLVWENVPGVLSSNDGRDFGTFLGALGELGYGFAYRVLDAQFCRAHGYERAVPQRRRRVFVVGYLGDWRRAAAVLFDGASLRGDPAPSRRQGKDVAPTIGSRPPSGGGLGTDFNLDGGLIAADIASTLPAGGNTTGGNRQPGMGAETAGTMLVARQVAASLTSNYGKQPDSSDTALGPNLVAEPIVLMERGRADGPNLETRQDGTSNAILTPNGGRGGLGVGAIAFDTTQITSKANVSNPKAGDPCHPLAAGAHPPAIAIQAGALRENPDSGPDGAGVQEGLAYTLEARAEVQAVQAAWAVRRLTPRECERLQGFPDDFTAVPYRGKPAADGPRYKALGNSMAVNVMRVMGTRIQMVEEMSA